MNLTSLMGALAALSATVAASVSVVRRFTDPTNRFPTIVWPVLALVGGVAYTLGWQINLAPAFVGLVPALVAQASRLTGVAGQVLTGLAAGAGAGFLYDFFAFIRSHTGPTGSVAATAASKKP